MKTLTPILLALALAACGGDYSPAPPLVPEPIRAVECESGTSCRCWEEGYEVTADGCPVAEDDVSEAIRCCFEGP